MSKAAVSRASRALVLTSDERQHLERSAHRSRDAAVPALRARVILLAAEGRGSAAIGARLGLAPSTVRLWRRRFLQSGLEGLRDRHRPGRPREVDDELLGAVIMATMGATYLGEAQTCSTRSVGERVGVSQSTVSRIWRTYGLLPPDIVRGRRRTSAELVGLYISLPVRAAAFVVRVEGSSLGGAGDDPRRSLSANAGPSSALLAALAAAAHRQSAHVEPQSFADFLCVVDQEVPAQRWIDILLDGASLLKMSAARVLWLRRGRFRWHVSRSYTAWLRRIGDWTRAGSEPKEGGDAPGHSVTDVVARVGHMPLSWTGTSERQVRGGVAAAGGEI